MHTFFDLAQIIIKVPHPFINSSLTDLGIVTDIDLEDNTVSLVFVWPFADIPIREQLVNSIKDVVSNLGFNLHFTERIMTATEKNDFLILEKQGWKK